MPLVLAAAGALGLAVGSFLNVVAHRLPQGLSLVRPASQCPVCAHPIRGRHNVPLLGWLVLRGRCHDCAAPISARYPAVELVTGLVFVIVTARLLQLGLPAAIPAYLTFVAAGFALALIDLDVRRLPDAITLPAYPVLFTLLVVATLVGGDGAALLRALVGAAATFALYYLLALAWPGGMGFGDVKTAGLVGAMLGYLSFPVLVVGVAAAFLLGAVVGVAALAVRGDAAPRALPFGPFLIAGAVGAVLVGQPVADAYRQLVLPS